jgi:hypothetical protein
MTRKKSIDVVKFYKRIKINCIQRSNVNLKFDFLVAVVKLDQEIIEKEKIIGSIKNEPKKVIIN